MTNCLPWLGRFLGQYGATRNDLLPARLCAVLSELHGNVTPHAYSYTCKIIEEVWICGCGPDIFEGDATNRRTAGLRLVIDKGVSWAFFLR